MRIGWFFKLFLFWFTIVSLFEEIDLSRETFDDDLVKLLAFMEVKHEGTLSSIVQGTQKSWLRLATKERWEISRSWTQEKKVSHCYG